MKNLLRMRKKMKIPVSKMLSGQTVKRNK